LNNSDLNMVTWEQRGTEGAPKFLASQKLPSFDYAEYARLLGLRGIRVDRPQSIGLAWEEALMSDRPMLLEMCTDPNVPPVPPHVSGKQLRHYAKALLQRDPDALQVVKASAKEWWDSVKPSRA
jgi:pyruvate dehydrogenase (quinone)